MGSRSRCQDLPRTTWEHVLYNHDLLSWAHSHAIQCPDCTVARPQPSQSLQPYTYSLTGECQTTTTSTMGFLAMSRRPDLEWHAACPFGPSTGSSCLGSWHPDWGRSYHISPKSHGPQISAQPSILASYAETKDSQLVNLRSRSGCSSAQLRCRCHCRLLATLEANIKSVPEIFEVIF